MKLYADFRSADWVIIILHIFVLVFSIQMELFFVEERSQLLQIRIV